MHSTKKQYGSMSVFFQCVCIESFTASEASFIGNQQAPANTEPQLRQEPSGRQANGIRARCSSGRIQVEEIWSKVCGGRKVSSVLLQVYSPNLSSQKTYGEVS